VPLNFVEKSYQAKETDDDLAGTMSHPKDRFEMAPEEIKSTQAEAYATRGTVFH
jgi:hypothetical protein